MRKSLSVSLFAAILLLSVFAAAQITYPVGPNTGFQTTPYSAPAFSVTFNEPVSVKTFQSTVGTSTNTLYSSFSHGVYQSVTVRTVDHDIAVDYSSSTFYANENTFGTEDMAYRSTDVWEGHPFTYSRRSNTENGTTHYQRMRYIIVNSRTAIFITQMSSEDYDDRPEWLDFEYSLRIR